MSRIGKLPITVPTGVDVAIDGQTVTVKGPKGTLSHTVREPIAVDKADDGTLEVKRPNDERRGRGRVAASLCRRARSRRPRTGRAGHFWSRRGSRPKC